MMKRKNYQRARKMNDEKFKKEFKKDYAIKVCT